MRRLTRHLRRVGIAAGLAWLLAGEPGVWALGQPGGNGAEGPGESRPAVTPEQLQADWLCQAVVRNLPPAPNRTGAIATTQDDAAGAVDGVIDGTFGFHTNRDQTPWWQVDLGSVETLGRIVVFNRCDGNVAARAARMEVLLSEDGSQWTQAYRHTGQAFGGRADGNPLEVDLAGRRARFVRLQLPEKQYFHLDEVQVFLAGNQTNVALGKPADQSSVSPWSRRHQPPAASPEETAGDSPLPVAQVVERGLQLAHHLGQLGPETAGAIAPEVAVLQSVAEAAKSLSDRAGGPAQRRLYLEACRAVRRISLANPLVDFDRVLFVKRVPGSFTHMSDQYYGWWSRPGGGIHLLEDIKSDHPRERCLTGGFPPGSFLRPDISHDARRVLFAYCRYFPELKDHPDKLNKANVPEEAFYHLFELDLESGRVRQITRGKYDDFDGRYLPDGRIVFLSTRRGQQVQYVSAAAGAAESSALPDCYVRCGGGPERPVAVYTLHVVDSNGEGLAPLSPFEMFEWTPSIDDDGRILYARWDYVDRHNMPYMGLWSTLPDGTNPRAVFGNFTTNPHCMFEARRIPGSPKLVFTASAHHGITGGSLVLLDPRLGPDHPAAMTRLTPEVCFPESEGWPATYYADPYPLSEKYYLVAWSASPLPPGTPRPHWGMPGEASDLGIYLFDVFGNLTLLYRDPTIGSMHPLPVRKRPKPTRVASVADPDAGQPAEARLMVVDVYRGLESIPRGTVRRLRIVGVPVKTHPTMNFPAIGLTHDDPGKFVLGTVPVEDDGSTYFRVPAGVSVFFQALDAEGKAVQTMRSATYLQPGQTQVCIGCHEPRNTAPPNQRMAAAARPPSAIAPGPSGSWPLDFAVLVEPVLREHCRECHRPGGEGEQFDLTPDKAYQSLVQFGNPSLKEHVLARYQQGRSVAGASAAACSPLVDLLKNGHHNVALGPDDWERLFTWMDTYGQLRGSFSQEQEQQLVELKRKWEASLAVGR